MVRKRPRSVSFVIALLVVTGGIVAAVPGLALSATDDPDYAVVQGDRCVGVSPITDDSSYAAAGDTVETFYDYRPDSHFSSGGTTGLQESDTSALALYDGPEGLSMVVLHDELASDTRGGSATFDVENLPADGEWAVLDDDYGGQDDRHLLSGTEAQLNWVWRTDRTDGAAFRGLGSAFAVEIEPRFNNDSRMRFGDDRRNGSWDDPQQNEGYNGTIDEWVVLSSTDDDVKRTALSSMEDAVTIHGEPCHDLLDLDLETTASNPVDSETPVGFEADGELSVESYEWTFGDGTTVTTEDGSVEHQYDDPGGYEVTVTATLASGATATTGTTVTVTSDDESLGAYTNEDGVAELDGVRDALDDWRGGQIGLVEVRTVIDSWRTEEPIA